MNKEYIALEKELAELLGWTKVEISESYGAGYKDGWWLHFPLWCSDDAAAFQLIVEHDCYPVDSYAFGTESLIQHIDVQWGIDLESESVKVEDYASKSEAVRVAVVKAVIAKLGRSDTDVPHKDTTRRIGAGDPEVFFTQFCDVEGFPSDGEMDEALRSAFYAGINYCAVLGGRLTWASSAGI